jgi:hypothetical protein
VIVISRLQAAEALAIRLMSASIASIAATAVITAVRAAIRPPHGGRKASDPLATPAKPARDNQHLLNDALMLSDE